MDLVTYCIVVCQLKGIEKADTNMPALQRTVFFVLPPVALLCE